MISLTKPVHPLEYWNACVEYRKKLKPVLLKAPPCLNKKEASEILSYYFESVSDKLLNLLELNKQKIEHLQPVNKFDPVAWISALLELELSLRRGENLADAKLRITELIPRSSILKAEKLLYDRYPNLIYLCGQCYIKKQQLKYQKILDKKESEFIASLPHELKEMIDNYNKLENLERKYYWAKRAIKKLKYYLANFENLTIRIATIYGKRTPYIDLPLSDPLDDIFPIKYTSYKGKIYPKYPKKEELQAEISKCEEILNKYAQLADEHKRLRIKIYKELKNRNLIPPKGTSLYQLFLQNILTIEDRLTA